MSPILQSLWGYNILCGLWPPAHSLQATRRRTRGCHLLSIYCVEVKRQAQ